MKTNDWNNEQISMYIYLANILPIKELIASINKGNMRDCDIKWLDGKLHTFTSDAVKYAKLDVTTDRISAPDFTYFNEHVKNYYLSKFTTLLEFFKKFRDNMNK